MRWYGPLLNYYLKVQRQESHLKLYQEKGLRYFKGDKEMRMYDCMKVKATQNIKKGELVYVTTRKTLRRCGPNNKPNGMARNDIKKGSTEILYTGTHIRPETKR